LDFIVLMVMGLLLGRPPGRQSRSPLRGSQLSRPDSQHRGRSPRPHTLHRTDPPGDAALTHAARLRGHDDADAVVVDLERYAQIASVAR
jgi:hypothetical protein